jgi:hypothetical protein
MIARWREAGGRRQTVLALGAGRRLAVACGLVALLWLAVGWALDWWP